MSSDALKVLLSIAGVFLGGVTGYYEVHRAELLAPQGVGVAFWLGFVMAGLGPIGAYLIGFYQINASNYRRMMPPPPESAGPVVTTTTVTAVDAPAVPGPAPIVKPVK